MSDRNERLAKALAQLNRSVDALLGEALLDAEYDRRTDRLYERYNATIDKINADFPNEPKAGWL